jgi:hypothetical protein
MALGRDGQLPFPCLTNGLDGDGHGVLCILAGKSPRGDHKHCVVGVIDPKSGCETSLTVIHDPHPDGTGLDDFQWAGFFVPTYTGICGIVGEK